MIEARLADGRILQFPDGTEPQVIQATVKRMLGDRLPEAIAPESRPREDILRELTLAQSQADIPKVQQLLGELEGRGSAGAEIIEPLATMVTGAVAEPLAGIAGIAQSINPFAEPGAGARAVEATRGALTFRPQTEAGQAGLEAVGEALQPVGEAIQSVERGLGDVAFEATGSPAIAAAATALPTAILSAFPAAKIFKNAGKPTKAQLKIMSELKKNPANPNLADFAVQSGKPRRVAALKEAVRQSGSPELVAVMKSSSPADKAAFSEMIKNIQTAKVDPVFGDRVRVGDTVGKALSNRLLDLKRLNNKAGKLVDRVSRAQLKGKKVDVSSARNQFKSSLDDLRVGYDPDTGVVNFAGSALEGSGAGQARDLVSNLAKRLKNTSIDASDAHFAKRLIDQKVSFGGAEGGFSGQIDNAIKALRSGINDSLKTEFPAYAKANKKYSDTINAINNFQDSVGSKVDLSSPQALGVSARRFTSNTQSRAKMIDAVDEIQEVLRDSGIQYKDDVLTQSHVANALENRFKTQGATTFKGEIRRGAEQAARGDTTGIALDVVGTAIDKVRGVTDDKALEALLKITKPAN